MSYGDTVRQVKEAVTAMPQGRVFGVASFAALGSPAAVESALRKLVSTRYIEKATRGRYYRPKESHFGGSLPASSKEIARFHLGTISAHTPLQPSGATAANQLGLSLQVPMTESYLSPGRLRPVRLANGRRIEFVTAGRRRMAVAGRKSGQLFEALRWLGKEEAASPKVCGHLRCTLSVEDKKVIADDLGMAPAWMRKIILKAIL